MRNLLGTDNPTPVFNEIFQLVEYRKYQSACQIQVATSPVWLEKDEADMWDSLKVESDLQRLVYEGCYHREKLGWQEVPHLMYDSIANN